MRNTFEIEKFIHPFLFVFSRFRFFFLFSFHFVLLCCLLFSQFTHFCYGIGMLLWGGEGEGWLMLRHWDLFHRRNVNCCVLN